MVQNRNMMVRPLDNALIKFTARAAFCGLSPNKMIKNLPKRTNKGAPGGWGICSLYAVDINSPQSQRLPVGSIVITYTVVAISPIIHPAILLTLLNVI